MEILHNTSENSANIRPYNSWIFFVLFQNFLFLNSATLRLEKFIGFSMRRTQTGCRLSRTTKWKDFNFSNVRHIGFDSRMPKLLRHWQPQLFEYAFRRERPVCRSVDIRICLIMHRRERLSTVPLDKFPHRFMTVRTCRDLLSLTKSIIACRKNAAKSSRLVFLKSALQ